MKEEILSIVEKHRNRDAKILPILHDIQDLYGYIPHEAIKLVAEELNIKPGKIYDAASFYAFFTFEKRGKHIIRLCNGLLCHLMGSEKIAEAIEERYGIKPGETTKDGLFTLELVECIGRCEGPPAMLVDDVPYSNLTPERAIEILRRYEE